MNELMKRGRGRPLGKPVLEPRKAQIIALLADGAKTVDELAARMNLDERAVRRALLGRRAEGIRGMGCGRAGRPRC